MYCTKSKLKQQHKDNILTVVDASRVSIPVCGMQNGPLAQFNGFLDRHVVAVVAVVYMYIV